MQEIFLKIRYYERGLLKSLKKVYFFWNPVPFNRQDYEKQKRENFFICDVFQKLHLLIYVC